MSDATTLQPLRGSTERDAERGAKYANLLLGSSLEAGDDVRVYRLICVKCQFFERIESSLGLEPRHDRLYGEFKRNPDVIAVGDPAEIPDEFVVFQEGEA